MTLVLNIDDVRELLDDAAVQWGPLAEAHTIRRTVVVDDVVLDVTTVEVRPRPHDDWLLLCATLDDLGARRAVDSFTRAQAERLARCDDVTEPWPVWRP